MGESFQEAYYGIMLVIIPGLFFNPLQIANTAMVVRKKVKHQAIINIVSGLINVALSVVLTKYLGVIGACASIFVAYMIRAVLMHIISWKILNIDISTFVKKCYIRVGIPIVLTTLLGFLMNHFYSQENWIALIIRGVAIIVTYCVLVIFIGLNKIERSAVIKKIIKS